jgi:hypothetical protein
MLSNGKYEFDFLNKETNFFDDDIDKAQIRYEQGEDLEHYGLREATDQDLEQAQQQGSHVGQKPQVDEYDFRMEGYGGGPSSTAPPLRPNINGVSQNTGPKGVKKDYEDAKKATKINREMDNVRRERLIKQHVTGKKCFYIDSNNQVQGFQQSVDEEGKPLDSNINKGQETTNNKVDQCNDEEYLRLFNTRQGMLQNYQDSVLEHQYSIASEYRRVKHLDELTSFLKSNHPDCYAILHIYDNENPICQRLHMVLEDLAPMFQHVLFLRGRVEDTMPSFDKRFLPTLIVYKNTQKVDSLIGVSGLWGMKPEDEAVVRTLNEKGFLKIPTRGYDKPSEAETRRHFLAKMEEDDDDDDWLDAE